MALSSNTLSEFLISSLIDIFLFLVHSKTILGSIFLVFAILCFKSQISAFCRNKIKNIPIQTGLGLFFLIFSAIFFRPLIAKFFSTFVLPYQTILLAVFGILFYRYRKLIDKDIQLAIERYKIRSKYSEKDATQCRIDRDKKQDAEKEYKAFLKTKDDYEIAKDRAKFEKEGSRYYSFSNQNLNKSR